MIGLLLQVGADKTMLDKKGRTALDLAKLNMREEIANLLERWLPVGLTYEQKEAMSAVPPDVLADEMNPKIKAQLKTLDMKMKLSGRNHIGLIHTYHKLAKMYREDSDPPRFEEAIDCLKRVVEIRKVNCGAADGGGEGGVSGKDNIDPKKTSANSHVVVVEEKKEIDEVVLDNGVVGKVVDVDEVNVEGKVKLDVVGDGANGESEGEGEGESEGSGKSGTGTSSSNNGNGNEKDKDNKNENNNNNSGKSSNSSSR